MEEEATEAGFEGLERRSLDLEPAPDFSTVHGAAALEVAGGAAESLDCDEVTAGVDFFEGAAVAAASAAAALAFFLAAAAYSLSLSGEWRGGIECLSTGDAITYLFQSESSS